MSEASRCQRAAARLLSLAPAAVQAEAKTLQPLLERLLLCQLQGREPLQLTAAELPELTAAAQTALQQLPVVLIEQGAQGAEVWSRRQHQQQQHLLMDLEQRLHQHQGLLLTGGAGTGKTTRVRQLLADERERQTLLLAPTGKAAARLREALSPLPASMQCSTLHRALEANPSVGFGRNQQRPIDAEVVVVDEVQGVAVHAQPCRNGDGLLVQRRLRHLRVRKVPLLDVQDPGIADRRLRRTEQRAELLPRQPALSTLVERKDAALHFGTQGIGWRGRQARGLARRGHADGHGAQVGEEGHGGSAARAESARGARTTRARRASR